MVSRDHTVYHIEYGFRKEAAVFHGDTPFAPNLYPAGDILRKWMLQECQLQLHPHNWKGRDGVLTNPHSYDASVLSAILSEIINQAFYFDERNNFYGVEEAEFSFIRFYTEFVIYSSRLLEALIKQMLFCTTFPEGDYRKATLGALLERNCNSCQTAKKERHKLSLLGSLAHRYGFCGGYENCLNMHMNIVRRRRNIEAAHSSTVEFRERSVADSKELLRNEFQSLGEELLHMLLHIGEIETHIIKEMQHYIAGGKYTPSYVIHDLQQTGRAPE